MKSRLIKAQNQRVERISTSTLVIGIDIAKEKHAAQAINFRGIVLTNSSAGRNREKMHIQKKVRPKPVGLGLVFLKANLPVIRI